MSPSNGWRRSWVRGCYARNLKSCNQNQEAGSGPTLGRQKNKTGLFSISCLGRRLGSFREDPGLPFHHAKPVLPKDGPTSRASELPVSCITAWRWTPGRIWTWMGDADPLVHNTLPHRTAPRPSEKGFPGSTKACVFLIVHSFIQQ